MVNLGKLQKKTIDDYLDAWMMAEDDVKSAESALSRCKTHRKNKLNDLGLYVMPKDAKEGESVQIQIWGEDAQGKHQPFWIIVTKKYLAGSGDYQIAWRDKKKPAKFL